MNKLKPILNSMSSTSPRVQFDEAPKGYKRTELGVIPEEWQIARIGEIASILRGASPRPINSSIWFDDRSETGWLRISDVTASTKYLYETTQRLSAAGIAKSRFVSPNNLVMSICATVGRPIITQRDLCIHDGFVLFDKLQLNKEFFYYLLSSMEPGWSKHGQTGSQMNLNTHLIGSTLIVVPSRPEQDAIAEALSAVNELLESLENLIKKKRAIKQGTMQQLLTGRTRLPGFTGEWKVISLVNAADCLDNLRIPLNEPQRAQMQGDIPYCGANGILDYVNDYVIDDDVILMAEDGGYFDEYFHRPIAYRMKGKCWVNNHAHILKAKAGVDQGFLFYSLVHKNILPFLASGTRAKLNKAELKKINICLPTDNDEQSAIATVLADIDAEIEALEQRRAKTANLKQGMMQQLLTGHIRLLNEDAKHD